MQQLDIQPINKPLDIKPLDIEPIDPVADAKTTLASTDNPLPNTQEQSGPRVGVLGRLKQAWDWANKPTVPIPSELKGAGETNPIMWLMRQATDPIAESLTTPLSIGLTAATAGENLLGGTAAKVLGGIGKAAGIPSMIEGAHDVYSEPGVGNKLRGAAKIAMGGLPFLHMGGASNEGNILANESGIPQFGGKGKPTGARQAGDIITVKAGEGLDKVQEIAGQGYQFSHQQPDGSYVFVKTPDVPLTETRVGNAPAPTPSNARAQLGPTIDKSTGSKVADIIALPRSILASTDMSAPLRQGLPLIHRPEFWKAIPDLVKAFGSEDTFNAIQESIANKPLFKPRFDAAGKELDSFAKQAGLKLTDLYDMNNKEEMLQSSLAEKIPLFGRLYRASERSYTGFLNKLRADTFESLINSKNIFSGDGETNLAGARAIADYINTSTGRGSLDFSLATKKGTQILPEKYFNLEKNAEMLGNVFFAPRLMASRMRMLNPMYYIHAPAEVRMERLKSLFAVAAAGNIIGQLGKMAGGEVENNPNSSDYGKVRFGNIHIDPWAGFQQYVVAANRLIRPEHFHTDNMPDDTGIVPADLLGGAMNSPGGHMKSTTSGNDYALDSKPLGSTKTDILTKFGRTKLNPVIGMAMDLVTGKDINGQKIVVPEEIASHFVPLFVQDVKALATENPNLIPNFTYGGDKEVFGGNDSYDEFHPKNLLAAPLGWFGSGLQVYKSKQ